MALGEAGGPVVTTGDLEQVFLGEVVVQTAEETEGAVGAVAFAEGGEFRRGSEVDVGQGIAQGALLVDRQARRAVIVEVGAQCGGDIVPAERSVIGEVAVGHVAVLEVADLAVEIIHGTVAEIASGQPVAHIHTLVGVVVAVGGGKAPVGIHVVVPTIGIVGDEFQAFRNTEGEPVGQGQCVFDAGVLVGIVHPDAAPAAEERRGCAVHEARLDVHGAVRIEGNIERTDVLGRIPKDTRLNEAALTVLLPESAVPVVGPFIGDVAGIVQPGGDFRIELGTE